MSGLICGVCGTPWKLDKPLLYHHDRLHCDSHACSRTCEECKDWEHAVEGGASDQDGLRRPGAQGNGPVPERPDSNPAGSLRSEQIPAAAPSFSKAPGYAAMMARLKGGESK